MPRHPIHAQAAMSPEPLRLVADIGGTHSRFALARRGALEAVATYRNVDFGSLQEAACRYLSMLAQPVEEACLAVAAPIDGDTVQLVNHDWHFSQTELAAALGVEHLGVINDFEAIAHALPHIAPADLAGVGGGDADPRAPVVVIGPGTGLGVGLRVPCGGGAAVIATEGGHACLGAQDEAEAALLLALIRAGHFPSRELLLSGRGLELLHRMACGHEPGERLLDAATIQQRAVAGGDAACVAALSHFCAFLGSAAGDQALATGARGGVFIAGGIVRRFVPFLRESAFRARFETRGPMSDYARRIPTRVICLENPGLLGAANAPL